jgi:hypothetical protein
MRERLIRRFVWQCVLASAVALATATSASAAVTQTFSTSQSEFTAGSRNQGWWNSTDDNFDANDNYIAGQFNGVTVRDFFTFDVSSACPASSVTLQLTRFTQNVPLTFSLFDVSTPAPTLNANVGKSQAIFDDLGSGTSFGSFQVATGGFTDVLSFPLNPAGVAAFNAARGGFFSIGGRTAEDAPGFEDWYLFGGAVPPVSGTQQLVATCSSFPTAKDQCKNGGWRNFPGFKNQGDCVSYVATKGKNQPSGH